MPLRSLIFALATAWLFMASAALADEEADREAASAAFVEGNALFEANDYAAALERFNAAQAIQPHDMVRIPIATCLERLARFREAIAQWEMVAASEQVEQTQRVEARDAIERLTPRLARVSIIGAPTGAELLIDDESRCSLPCQPAVDPGEHILVVRTASGDDTRRIVVERGEQRRVDLSPAKPMPPAPSAAPTRSLVTDDADEAAFEPGPLTWVGAGLTAVGIAGVVGFGLHANAKHDAYEASPSDDTRDDGLLARNLSNGSIAVGAVGVVLLVVDLVFLAPGQEQHARVGPDGLTVVF
jgi:Anaphase-promoting complex, cyclosome, subunit 3